MGPEALKPVYEVRESYIQSAFDEIDSQYGCIDNYLVDEMGLTEEKRKLLQFLRAEKKSYF